MRKPASETPTGRATSAARSASKKRPQKRTTAATKTPADAKSSAAPTGMRRVIKAGAGVRIRHYCQGVGDCHLLRFPRDGQPDFLVLIDCGIHTSIPGGSEKIARIVEDIAKVTGGRIDLLVVTHEHWDHVSGFSTAADAFAAFEVGQVWCAWTEDPNDPEAQQLDTYKGKALAALQLASNRLSLSDAAGQELGLRIENVLGFPFGAKGDRVRAARDKAIALGKGNVVYRKPGEGPLALDGVDTHHVYVLGPPRDRSMIRLEERASEMYHFAGSPMAEALRSAMSNDTASDIEDTWRPFDRDVGYPSAKLLAEASAEADREIPPKPNAVQTGPSTPEHSARQATVDLFSKHYVGPTNGSEHGMPAHAARDQSWRCIASDWLRLSADLAMQLDAGINNTSLVLAFETTRREQRQVLLFAADAQIGSWLTWPALHWGEGSTRVTGRDLLERTVYLKVSHHGSHNGTRKGDGLELMRHKDLAAFVPTNKHDAENKCKWRNFPFDPLLDVLGRKSQKRLIRADDAWIAAGVVPDNFKTSPGCIAAVTTAPDGSGLWVEVELA